MNISIVVPLFNEEESLPELYSWIEHVMKANGFSYEVIFVNDGSTDQESLDVLKQYENDEKIRIINIKNKGLANARNVGAEAAKGGVGLGVRE